MALRDWPMSDTKLVPLGVIGHYGVARVIVAHDHMRQNADIFDLRTFFDGQQNLRPFQMPGVPGMALRDWPMWSSATTGWRVS